MRFSLQNILYLAASCNILVTILTFYSWEKEQAEEEHREVISLPDIGGKKPIMQPDSQGVPNKTKVEFKHVTFPSSTMKKKPIMYGEFWGRLGNHIWLYASMYGLARQSDRHLYACNKYNLTKLFSNLSVHLHPFKKCHEVIPNGTEILRQGSSLYYNPHVIQKLKSDSEKDIFVIGFLQNMLYFFNFTDDIKAQLVIRDIYQSQAQEYLHSVVVKEAVRRQVPLTMNSKGEALLGGKAPVFVLVHVRRSDHLKSTWVNLPGQAFFAHSMAHMRQKHGKMVVFIVATDAVPWSMANINGSDVYFTGEKEMKSVEVDFAIGVACNHTITAISTLSWWIGFLAEGDVIYLRDWARSVYKRHYVEEQYFPRNWIPM